MNTRAYLSIGDVLTLLRQEFPDVTISKIRFLESQGLVNPERSPSGYRKFYEHDVARLRWVLRQQREHFLPLKVIRDRLEHEGDKVLDDPQQVSARDDLVAVGAEVPNAEALRADSTRSESGHPAESPRPEPMATVRALPTGGSARSQGGDAFPRALRRPSEPSIMRGPGATGHGEPSLEHHPAHPRSAGLGLAPERAGEDPVPQLDHGATQHQLGRGMDEGSGVTASLGGPTVGGGWHSSPAGGGGEPVPPGPTASSGPSTPTGQADAPGSRGGAVGEVAPGTAAASGVGSPAGGGPHVPHEASPGPLSARVVTGASFTADELCSAGGVSPEVLGSLERFGLVAPLVVAGVPYYDEDALTITRLAAELAEYGVEPRHLTLYRNAVDREVGLVEQIITPLLRQRNPEARQRAVEASANLTRLGESLRSALLRRELRRQLGT